MPVVETLRGGAQVVIPEAAPLGGALVEETMLLSRWLAQPGVRIVCSTDGFVSPVNSAGPWLGWAGAAETARLTAAEALRSPDAEVVRRMHPGRGYGRTSSTGVA